MFTKYCKKQTMRIALNFRKPFTALEEALISEGCTLLRDVWPTSNEALDSNIDAWIVDFCDSARHLWKTLGLSGALKRAGLPMIGIARDAPWHKGVKKRRQWAMKLLSPLDIYASHSLQDAWGFSNSLYFPNAARTSVYSLGNCTFESLRDPGAYKHDVSFLGNVNYERYPEHEDRSRFLADLRKRLARNNVIMEIYDSANMSSSEQVEVIQKTRINLNYGAAADCTGERTWGLPERCYGIPACGGFLLSDYRNHAAIDFKRGVDWVDFSDMNDCESKIYFYLSNFSLLRDIAEAAYRRVTTQHTYIHRARLIISTIENLKLRNLRIN